MSMAGGPRHSRTAPPLGEVLRLQAMQRRKSGSSRCQMGFSCQRRIGCERLLTALSSGGEGWPQFMKGRKHMPGLVSTQRNFKKRVYTQISPPLVLQRPSLVLPVGEEPRDARRRQSSAKSSRNVRRSIPRACSPSSRQCVTSARASRRSKPAAPRRSPCRRRTRRAVRSPARSSRAQPPTVTQCCSAKTRERPSCLRRTATRAARPTHSRSRQRAMACRASSPRKQRTQP